jgi:SPP1 family phage portal protein
MTDTTTSTTTDNQFSYQGSVNGNAGHLRFSRDAHRVFKYPKTNVHGENIYENEQQLFLIAENLLSQFEGTQMPRIRVMRRYYENETDIKLFKERAQDDRANFRISHNFAKYIADTSSAYFMGSPITYKKGEDESLLDLITDAAKINDENSHNYDLSLDCSVYGRAHELVWNNEDNEMRFARVIPGQAFVVYDTDIDETPLFAVRFYDVTTDYDQQIFHRYIELYTPDKRYYFQTDLNETWGNPYQVVDNPLGFVQIIEYRNNNNRIGDFENVMDKIDAYDWAQSNLADFLEDSSDAYLVLQGQPDTDQGDVAYQLKHRVLVLRSPDPTSNVQPDAKYVVKEYDTAGAEAYKKRIAQDIHKMSFVPDLSDVNFAGNITGEAMKYKLFGLEQIRIKKARLFRYSLMQRLRIMAHFWSLRSQITDETAVNDISIVFDANIPQNTTDAITNAKNLTGIVSRETQLAMLPSDIVDDPQQEMDKIKQDDPPAPSAGYVGAFGQQNEGDGQDENNQQNQQ